MQFHLNLLVNLIIQEHFYNSRCILIFSDNNNFEYEGELGAIHISVSGNSFNHDVVFNYFGCQGILLNVATPVTFLVYLEYQLQHHTDRFNNRKYLIIPTADNTEDSFFIFDLTTIDFIADLLLIRNKRNHQVTFDKWGFEDDVRFQVYTHRFVGFNGSNEKVLLDEWVSENRSFLYKKNLYPEKIYDGAGRPFRIATFNYKPYAVPATREGTELQIAIEYSKKHNLTAVFILDDVGEWGEAYDNWTGYGIIGNVLLDYADIGLASIGTWQHEYGFLDFSKPLIRTGVTCLTPAPTLTGGWPVPFFPFTYDMWAAVMISFLLCSVTVFFIEFYTARSDKYEKENILIRYKTKNAILTKSVVWTTAVFLLQSIPEKRKIKYGPGKPLYICMFIFSILVASNYISGLTTSIVVPRYTAAIKTIQELLDSGIYWGAPSIAWVLTITGTQDCNDMMLLKRFVVKTSENLRQHNNKRFAFAVERLPAGYYAIGEYVTEEGVQNLRIMSDDIYWDHCISLARKSSIWLPSYDQFTLLLAQSGIAQVWEHRVVIRYSNWKIQHTVKYFSRHGERMTQVDQVKWTHVEGSFIIWAIGIFVSTVIFFLEIVIDKMVKNNVLLT